MKITMGNKQSIEEAAEKYYEQNIDGSNIPREHWEYEIQDMMVGFASIWQSEKMFNKEEVELLIKDAYSMGKSNIKEEVVNRWWNQRKIGKI